MIIVSSKNASELFPPEFINDSYFLKVFKERKPLEEYSSLINTGTITINGFTLSLESIKKYSYKVEHGYWYTCFAPSKKVLRECLSKVHKNRITKICEIKEN